MPTSQVKISERFYNSEQSWWYERIIKFGSERLRVLIRRNSYDDQSYVRGYIYSQSDNRWNPLVEIPIQLAHCGSESCVLSLSRVSRALFEKDADNVILEMLEIIK